MQWKDPKNTEKYFWTEHSKHKMRFYGLSSQRVLRVVRNPFRIEEGIVSDTIAVMQPNTANMEALKNKQWKYEIWVMYQIRKPPEKKEEEMTEIEKQLAKFTKPIKDDKQLKMISAWRYPGVSSENDPIPEEILREVESIL